MSEKTITLKALQKWCKKMNKLNRRNMLRTNNDDYFVKQKTRNELLAWAKKEANK